MNVQGCSVETRATVYSMCLCVSSQWVVVLFWYGIHVANVATWGHASAISTGQI